MNLTSAEVLQSLMWMAMVRLISCSLINGGHPISITMTAAAEESFWDFISCCRFAQTIRHRLGRLPAIPARTLWGELRSEQLPQFISLMEDSSLLRSMAVMATQASVARSCILAWGTPVPIRCALRFTGAIPADKSIVRFFR